MLVQGKEDKVRPREEFCLFRKVGIPAVFSCPDRESCRCRVWMRPKMLDLSFPLREHDDAMTGRAIPNKAGCVMVIWAQ